MPKINKKHQGKEFKSFFRFVGKVKKTVKGVGEDAKQQPIFQTTKTQTGKDRRVLQFDVLTNKYNNVKVDVAGMEFEFANLFSSTHKKSFRIKWADRNDKTKYPDKTYHLITPDWDLAKELSEKFNEGDWVEVRGKYEFDRYTNNEGKESLFVKRIINSVEKVEDGQEITLRDKSEVKYVCDFDSPDFVEVNYFELEIGIKSTWQDEETKDTVVNAVFLDYGKERSTPKDVKLVCYYQEPEEGKKALADAFAKLQEYDFVQVVGVDNNRPIFSEVTETAQVDEDDPFAEVGEQVAQTSSVISGNKKGLEITSIVVNTYQKQLLTEEEIKPTAEQELGSEISIDDDDLPF